jgi:exonuclease III
MINMNYPFCSWNLRGLGQKTKCNDVLAELIDINPSLILMQEIKLSEIISLKAKTFLRRRLQSFSYKPANGSAGGILNAASSNHFKLENSTIHNFALSSANRSISSNQSLTITNAYARTDHLEKMIF